MSGLADNLGKQIGPLPLGAWVAVVGTGLGVALWTKRNSAGTATDGGVSTGGGGLTTNGGGTPEDYVGVGGGGAWSYTGGGTTETGTGTGDTSGDGVQQITDNDSWARAAINYLIASNYDAANSQAAIQNALQGNALSVSQYALWTVALAHMGAPPFPVDILPPVSVPGPTTGTTPPPVPTPSAGGVWWTMSLYATLYRISNRFYGTDKRWDDIWRANSVYVHRPNGTLGFLTTADRVPTHVLSKYAGRKVWIPK